MAQLKRKAGHIYYEVKGDPKNEVLILLRGLGRSSRYWLGFDQLMAQYFRVVTIDMRGLGRSTQRMEWGDEITTLGNDCLAVMDALDIDRFHLFGLSFGGMIAASIGATAPDRVLSLAIGASSSGDYVGFRLNPRMASKLLLALRGGRFQDALLEAVVPGAVLRTWGEEIQASWQEILDAEGFPLTTVLKQIRASVGHKIKGRLGQGRFPILFVHGSLDGFVPMRNSQRLHRLVPGSELRIIKGAGHELALGYEQELSQVLRQFAAKAG